MTRYVYKDIPCDSCDYVYRVEINFDNDKQSHWCPQCTNKMNIYPREHWSLPNWKSKIIYPDNPINFLVNNPDGTTSLKRFGRKKDFDNTVG